MGRLDGLDSSYFDAMTPEEREKAFEYLLPNFDRSVESVKGLYLAAPEKAIDEFKSALQRPPESSSYVEVMQQIASARILMISYLLQEKPSTDLLKILIDYYRDPHRWVRNDAIQSTPTRFVTPDVIAALKEEIFVEVERLPRASAIQKLLAIYGVEFDSSHYNKIYRLLSNESGEKKKHGFEILEKDFNVTYVSETSPRI